jgi:Tfp pilus assembly protein PilF
MRRLPEFLVCSLMCGVTPALADLVPLLKKAPSTPAGEAFQRGVDLLAARKMPEAETEFRRSLQLDSSQGISYVGLADLAFRKHQYAEAEKYYRQALHNDPKNSGIHESWGRFLFEIRRYGESATSLRQAADMDPRNGPVRIALGDALLRGQNGQSEALEAYRAGLKLAPDHAGGHFGLGMVLLRLGQTDQAKAEFERSAQLAPHDPRPMQALGELLLSRNDGEGALRTFQLALDRDPKYYLAYLSRGDVFYARKDFGRAIEQYSKVCEIQPKLVLAKLKLGVSWQAKGNRGEARKAYLDAIGQDPNSALAYNNLASMAADSGSDLGNALLWARKAASLAPGSSAFLDTSGWVHHLNGKDAEAFVTLKKAAGLPSPGASTFYHLGVVANSIGRRADAKDALEGAVKMDPSFPEAADARLRLSQMPR